MKQTQHLVQKNQKGKIKFITLTLDGDTLTRAWGQLGGKVQTTPGNKYPGKNIGKKNELSPEQVAKNDFDKLIRLRCKEGYVKADSLEDLPDLDDSIDDINLDDIPTCFCPSKPTKKISDKALDKLIQDNRARFFIKYNGGCHFVVVNSENQVKIFTRRWEDHTIKYPDIVKDTENKNFPPGTMILAEFCIEPALGLPHMTAYNLMSKISKTEVAGGVCKPDQTNSIALQKRYPVRAAVVAFLYYNNYPTWQMPFGDMLDLMSENIAPRSHGFKFFLPEEIKFDQAKKAKAYAKKYKTKHEGLIVWDTTKSIEITMNGKPNRRASWKIKPNAEMDVIAHSWVEGTGKNQGRIGAICLCKFDKNNKRIDLGTVGSGPGLSDKDRNPANWSFPCVVEIKYANIFPDTQKFQQGTLSKVHENKVPEDLGWPGEKAA